MTDAAQAVIESLTEAQRADALWPFADTAERERWFYTPTDHGGVTLSQLDPHQQRAVMRLVRTALSRPGYVTAVTVIGLENVLDELESWTTGWENSRGRDPQRYYLRFFGRPGDATWGWRFGGHHVSLNFTIDNGEVAAMSPLFFGADPADSPLLGGAHLRPLGAHEDLARDLLALLNDNQREVAVVSSVPPVDLVGANRAHLAEGDGPLRLAKVWRNEFTGELLDLVEGMQDREEAKIDLRPEHIDAVRFSQRPKGLAVSAMNDRQRSVMRELVWLYVDRLNESIVDTVRERTETSFDQIHFAWAGGLERGRAHYYRLQGPRFLAEYDNTTRDANHVHTVWRDPVNDFGRDALGEHRRHHDH